MSEEKLQLKIRQQRKELRNLNRLSREWSLCGRSRFGFERESIDIARLNSKMEHTKSILRRLGVGANVPGTVFYTDMDDLGKAIEKRLREDGVWHTVKTRRLKITRHVATQGE